MNYVIIIAFHFLPRKLKNKNSSLQTNAVFDHLGYDKAHIMSTYELSTNHITTSINECSILKIHAEYWLLKVCIYVYVTVNLRNQLFPGFPNPFREFRESLKCIEIPRNL